jgi:hypothetical protein
MNIQRSITFGLALVAGAVSAADAVTEEQSWQQTYRVAVSAPLLEIENIWGSVRVRAGNNGEIVVTATELRSAPTRALLERSRQRLRLDVQADTGGVSMLVGDRDERRHRQDDCNGCRVDYQFDVRVPPGTRLEVGTVLDGIVDIQDVHGHISASNVNGPISVGGMRDCETIDSVNGKVHLGFSRAPTQDCHIETVNGDVTIEVPGDANFDVALDLFNGDVRSELPVDTFSLPTTVEQVVDDGRKRYRVQQLAGVRIGAGGPIYEIASINGDVRIAKHP